MYCISLNIVLLLVVQEQLSAAVCPASNTAEWEAPGEDHQHWWVLTTYIHRHSQ